MLYEIYLVTNLVNNKKYIGQTKKGRLKRRWFEHSKVDLNDNRVFHNAIKKYGIENFKIEIIETNISEELIDEREKYYIEYFNTFYLNNQGYNMTLGGQGVHGYTFSEETKQLISESNIKAWQEIKKDHKKYTQLCLNRSKALKGRKMPDTQKIKLSKIASQRIGEKNPFFGKHFSEESKEKLRNALAKNFSPINAFDLKTGELWKTFRFATDAVAELNLQPAANSRILLVCKEQKGHAYGYIWRYKKDFDVAFLSDEIVKYEKKTPRAKTILQYDLENNFIAEYESAAQASRVLQEDSSKQRTYAKAINEVCRGKRKTAHKYIWKYKY